MAIGVFVLSATVNAAVLYLVSQTIPGEVKYLGPAVGLGIALFVLNSCCRAGRTTASLFTPVSG